MVPSPQRGQGTSDGSSRYDSASERPSSMSNSGALLGRYSFITASSPEGWLLPSIGQGPFHFPVRRKSPPLAGPREYTPCKADGLRPPIVTAGGPSGAGPRQRGGFTDPAMTGRRTEMHMAWSDFVHVPFVSTATTKDRSR